MTPEQMLDRILYKDQDVIVLDKPAGLPVHAGPNSPDHLELYLDALRFGWAQPPRLAHRLDRDTSGCLALGRHDKAIRRLGKLFMQGRIDKAYWAVVTGGPEGESGVVDLPLLKLTGKGGWRIVCDPAGQAAVTEWRVLGRGDGLAWIECVPRTGRTHQIRVHMKALGCPVRGDRYYGPDPETTVPLHLHSRRLGIPPLSAGKPPILAEAPPPSHMIAALAACGWIPGAVTG
ncbi:RluA family pseudouridine synthase [Magnetospirillum sp. UT-4]|uniref:RluA family pseudouridine synthase n=1 Tax=Magnetospirillum sp. UT-4 TaxID=2681467 RepID=UPI00137EFF6D|nr:RNA pseudouridine synthase [Magnetospirillum sp. UT-4]CAA7613220.1 putative enzyme [Magnetospirillum sp. UT-4]